MSDSDIEPYVQKPTYKFLGTRTPLRSEICPSPVVAGLREKYEGLRESLNPLHEVAKKAAYIDTLIYLLREQGFEFHQSLDGEHQLIDLIGRKKVKIKVIDDSNAEDETDGGIHEDHDSNEIDETQDTIKLMSSSRKRMMHYNTTHEKTCNGKMVKTNKKIAIRKDDEASSINHTVKTNSIKGIITKNYNGTVRRPPTKYSQTKTSYNQKDVSRHYNSSKKHMINMKSTNKKLNGTPASYIPPDLAYVEVPSISAALKAMYIKV
ncbi:17190_t:CDS:1 [Dentiscutata heterogama]|uniref:17190_t:CDS:1 n=1 Tax=Dentiscutata heterogama TaxID=1316150 RepID=A0ACA9LT60_9GLOM|nr:17190_t:CDS:1 [Dentiscutata heterogama]